MRITRWICRSSVSAMVAAACLSLAAVGKAQAAGDPPRPPAATRPAQPPTALSGTVQSFNFDIGGLPNAILLRDSTGREVQVNFPHGLSSTVTAAVAAGDQITLTATGRLSMPDHPVYELRSLKTAKGQEIKVAQPHTEGTIKRLNYSTDGKVDGAILDSGEFVHVDQHEAEQLNLAVGQKMTVDGIVQPSRSATAVIVATAVNGKTLRPEPANRPEAERAARERGGRGPMGGRMMRGGPGAMMRGGPGGFARQGQAGGMMRGGPENRRGGFDGREGMGRFDQRGGSGGPGGFARPGGPGPMMRGGLENRRGGFEGRERMGRFDQRGGPGEFGGFGRPGEPGPMMRGGPKNRRDGFEQPDGMGRFDHRGESAGPRGREGIGPDGWRGGMMRPGRDDGFDGRDGAVAPERMPGPRGAPGRDGVAGRPGFGGRGGPGPANRPGYQDRGPRQPTPPIRNDYDGPAPGPGE